LIANETTAKKALVHGKVTIVVYRGDANKLEISGKKS